MLHQDGVMVVMTIIEPGWQKGRLAITARLKQPQTRCMVGRDDGINLVQMQRG